MPQPGPTPLSAPPRAGFERRLVAARFALAWERLWPALWPGLAVVGTFLALALFDLPARLPSLLHLALLVVFAALLGFALWHGVRRLRLPDRDGGAAAHRDRERIVAPALGRARGPARGRRERPGVRGAVAGASPAHGRSRARAPCRRARGGAAAPRSLCAARGPRFRAAARRDRRRRRLERPHRAQPEPEHRARRGGVERGARHLGDAARLHWPAAHVPPSRGGAAAGRGADRQHRLGAGAWRRRAAAACARRQGRRLRPHRRQQFQGQRHHHERQARSP